MKSVKWTFNISPDLDAMKLGPDHRRQLFLIFKEAITNAARHSQCGTVGMSMTLSHNKLVAEIADDGCGFATQGNSNGSGQGLESMKRRASHLGGEMSIWSAPGRGTLLRLEVPVR
jgi:signal transduction histidine kinase